MNKKPQTNWQAKLHEIIFEADTRAGQLFDVLLLVAILISVGVICAETVENIAKSYETELRIAEWFFTILFTVEYVLRLFSVHRPLSYMVSFYGIIDLISILPMYTLLWSGTSSFGVVRSLRLLRVFRILKLIHLTSESEDLASAIWRARGKVVVFLSVVLICVTIAGTAMYEVENRERKAKVTAEEEAGNESIDRSVNSSTENVPAATSQTKFKSIPDSIYWAIVTMTTVGYGDIVPQTALGKLLSAVLILVGYSLIIVPTGFVSAELIDSKMTKSISTQVCSHCMAERHQTDAEFCRCCGHALHAR